MDKIDVYKQISLSKFLAKDSAGQNYVIEFYPGIIEFNIETIKDAIKNCRRENDSDYYLTRHNFKPITKFYLRKFDSLSDIAHLFPSLPISISEPYK